LRIEEIQRPKIRVTIRSGAGGCSKDSVHARSGGSGIGRISGSRWSGQKGAKLGVGKERDAIGNVVMNSVGTSCGAKRSKVIGVNA
jgi:hypothetical protein